MKQKLLGWIPSAIIALALSTSAGFSSPTITVNTYDASGSISGVWDWYGGSTLTWDATQDHSGNSGGSLHIAKNTANDHIFVPQSASGNQWDNGTPANSWDLTLYTNLSVWIKWDTNSSMSIADFNANLGGLTMFLNDNHLGQYDWSGNGLHSLPAVLIPNAASNGWVHLNFPVSPSIPFINTIGSIIFDAYHTAPWSGTVQFWVDDITFDPSTITIIPPPVIRPLVKATTGLTVFASTSASQFDRQSVVLKQTAGTSWIGQASVGNPVSYSFTISSFPTDPATYGCEAWMFLSPNPQTIDNAPDWNETNMVIAFIQLGSSNATLNFQYKVSEDHQQAMYSGGNETRVDTSVNPGITNHYYYSSPIGSQPAGPIVVNIGPNEYNITNESGFLGTVTAPSALGTWTIRFTSDTNVTLIAPGGNTTNVVIPPHKISGLNPGANGLYAYLGMQANNTATYNQAVVYSNFAISGSGTPFTDNFSADAVLDTNAWQNSQAAGPLGVLIAPAGSAYWLTWTLPDAGFKPEIAATLGNPLGWGSATGHPAFPQNGVKSQLIASGDLPAGKDAFFALIKRSFSKLQVLLPGETNAPNTLTGKIGTPIAQSAFVPFNVTVNAVDDTWHVVNSPADTIALSSSAGGNFFVDSTPTQLALSGGTVTFSVEFEGDDAGTVTITATDVTDGSKTPDTSTPFTD